MGFPAMKKLEEMNIALFPCMHYYKFIHCVKKVFSLSLKSTNLVSVSSSWIALLISAQTKFVIIIVTDYQSILIRTQSFLVQIPVAQVVSHSYLFYSKITVC